MLDFAKWTQDASAFLRRLTWLPGRIEVHDVIEPPSTDRRDREWMASEKCCVPPEIARFLATASRRCYIRYEWTPPPDSRHGLSAAYPNQHTLVGGGDFCEKAKYSNYDNRERIERLLGPIKEISRLAGLEEPRDCMEVEHNHGRIPLMELPNGDNISLTLDTLKGSRAVFYVETDANVEPRMISTSFEQFLLDWERICYVRLTPEYLAPWIDPQTGQLNPDREKADALRALLLTDSDDSVK